MQIIQRFNVALVFGPSALCQCVAKSSQVVYFRNPSGGTGKNISERTSGMTRQ